MSFFSLGLTTIGVEVIRSEVDGKRLPCFTLRPGVNFINIHRTAFTLVDPESIKR